jgi:serine/threonine-protein kinase RsbW
MDKQIVIVVSNQLSELGRTSHSIEAFGARHALDTRLIFNVNLAVDEILTNIISYAYPDGGSHDIVVRLSLTTRELIVEVEDDGQAFNPLELGIPDLDKPLEQRPIGGLGIHLVRKVMDRLEYRRQAGKNVLLMAKTVY